jgi:hypothetical protein
MITEIRIDGNLEESLSQVSINSIECEFKVGFDTEEERDLFVAQFPKSMKVRTFNDDVYTAFICVTSTKTWYGTTNEVTGSTNEQGMKRLIKFYKAIELELSK